jgi:hypothetical protein
MEMRRQGLIISQVAELSSEGAKLTSHSLRRGTCDAFAQDSSKQLTRLRSSVYELHIDLTILFVTSVINSF